MGNVILVVCGKCPTNGHSHFLGIAVEEDGRTQFYPIPQVIGKMLWGKPGITTLYDRVNCDK